MSCNNCNSSNYSITLGICEYCRSASYDDRIDYMVERAISNHYSSFRFNKQGEVVNGGGLDLVSVAINRNGKNGNTYTIYGWTHGGCQAIKDTTVEFFGNVDLKEELNKAIKEKIDELIKLVDSSMFQCSICKNKFKNEHIAGRHFAGIYCTTCWERYKATHSNVECSVCKTPVYMCHC